MVEIESKRDIVLSWHSGLNYSSKSYVPSLVPWTCVCDLIYKKSFENSIKLKMWKQDQSGFWVGLKSNNRCPLREKKRDIWDTDKALWRQRLELYHKTNSTWRHQKLEGMSPRTFRRSVASLVYWIQTSDYPNSEKIHFYCFKTPNLC